jgi:hypothetical protein
MVYNTGQKNAQLLLKKGTNLKSELQMDLYSTSKSDKCGTFIYVGKEERLLSEILWSELPKGLRLMSCYSLSLKMKELRSFETSRII